MRSVLLCSAAAHVAGAPLVDSSVLSAQWAAEDDARWEGRREMSLVAALEGNLRANRQPPLKVWNTCPCVTPSYCHFPEGASKCPHTGTCHGTGVLCDCNDCYRNDKGANNTVCTDCPAPTPPPTQPIPPTPTPGAFEIWADPPGSELYEKYSPQWYNHIYVRATLTLDFIAEESAHFTANSTTSTYRGTPNGVGDDGDVFVDVAMGEHGAIHLYADPGFQQIYDNRVRALSNASAAMNFTGVLDRCGWPLPHGKGAAGTKGAGAPCTTHPCTNEEFARSSAAFHDDFSSGLDPAKWTVALLKGCCERTTDANMFQRNIYSTWDTEGAGAMGGGGGAMDTDGEVGAPFPVLALRAHANDDDTGEGKSCCNGTDCPGKTCHKIVTHSGTIASAGLYASGRYDVVAKVPASSGLIWAVWTYHYEEHFPADCTRGQVSFVYRYISRESCSQFDSLPLTSLTISARGPVLVQRDAERPVGVDRGAVRAGAVERRTGRAGHEARLQDAEPLRPLVGWLDDDTDAVAHGGVSDVLARAVRDAAQRAARRSVGELDRGRPPVPGRSVIRGVQDGGESRDRY
jgi:hypothetical protein